MNSCFFDKLFRCTFCAFLAILLLTNVSSADWIRIAGWNPIKHAYEAQKMVIRQAQEKVEHAARETAKSIDKTDEAEASAEEAARKAAEAREKQKEMDELTKKNQLLESALAEAQTSLLKAKADLSQAKTDLEYRKGELGESKSYLETINEKNDKVGEKAGLFDFMRSGLLASLVANFIAAVAFWNSIPKRRVELKKLKVDLAIQEYKLAELKAKPIKTEPAAPVDPPEPVVH